MSSSKPNSSLVGLSGFHQVVPISVGWRSSAIPHPVKHISVVNESATDKTFLFFTVFPFNSLFFLNWVCYLSFLYCRLFSCLYLGLNAAAAEDVLARSSLQDCSGSVFSTISLSLSLGVLPILRIFSAASSFVLKSRLSRTFIPPPLSVWTSTRPLTYFLTMTFRTRTFDSIRNAISPGLNFAMYQRRVPCPNTQVRAERNARLLCCAPLLSLLPLFR